MNDTISNTVAEHIETSTFADLSIEDVEWAKLRIADSIGVFLAGVHGLGNNRILQLINRWGGTEESSILALGGKVPAHNAAWINSLMLRSYDFEVIDAETEEGTTLPAHITGTTVPVMFAAGELTRASGKELLTALILGDDVTARLISSGGFDLYGDYFDANGTANSIGATTVASKLFYLDATSILNAYALNINMCSGSMENVFQGTWAFKLPVALSARNGIISAEMAESGLSGVRDPFDGKRCYFDMFGSQDQKRELLISKLGERFYSDIVIKPWPSCHATQYAIDAALEITLGKAYSPDEIESIIVRVSPGTKSFVGQEFEFGNTNQPSGAFSLHFTVATAILYGALRPEHYSSEAMSDPMLGAMLDKINIVDNGPRKGAIVEINYVEGSSESREINESLGHIKKKPMTEDQVFEKYLNNVLFSNTIEMKKAEKAFELALRLEELDSLVPIINLITP